MRNFTICTAQQTLSGLSSKHKEMSRECGTNGEWGGAYEALVGRAEGKRTLGRIRRRWGIMSSHLRL